MWVSAFEHGLDETMNIHSAYVALFIIFFVLSDGWIMTLKYLHDWNSYKIFFRKYPWLICVD